MRIHLLLHVNIAIFDLVGIVKFQGRRQLLEVGGGGGGMGGGGG